MCCIPWFRLLSGCGRSCAQKEPVISLTFGILAKVCFLMNVVLFGLSIIPFFLLVCYLFLHFVFLFWNRCRESFGCCFKGEGVWRSEAVEASCYKPPLLGCCFHSWWRSRCDGGQVEKHGQPCSGHPRTWHTSVSQLCTSTSGGRSKEQAVAGTRYNILNLHCSMCLLNKHKCNTNHS